ncbi:MAG: DUF2723 domain-containing protein [Actinobacteria bacterium]|nr:DUF2723 domain-containing protein [Actinomycetota bacterium]
MENKTVAVPAPRASRGGTLSLLKEKPDTLIYTALFAATMVFHVITAARAVTFSDSGDFLMGVALMGNIHGPGYPTYLMSAKIFSLIFPLGSLPFRMSIYSGLFAALTTCLLYRVVFRMTHSRTGGAVAGLAFAFSYTYWYQSVIPESYSINTFFIALLMVLILRWERLVGEGRDSSADNTLALIAFCYGLAVGNHFSIIILVPAFAFFALDTDWRRVLAPRNLARMAAFFALGVLPYIYEPVAAFRGAAYNYGDPSTPIRWIHHMTVYYQRGGLFKLPLKLLPARFWRFFGTLTTEYPYFFWLGAVGLIASFLKRRKKYAVFLAFLFLLSALSVMTYRQIEPVLRAHFYYPAYMIVSIWIGYAAAYLLRAVRNWGCRRDSLVAGTVATVLASALMLCPLASLLIHYDKVDKSSYHFAEDQARNMLDTASDDGVIMVDSDNVIFPLLYTQYVEGYRPTVRVVSASAAGVPGFHGQDLAAVNPPGYLGDKKDDSYVQIIERNYGRLPVYTSDPTVIQYDWQWDWLGYLDRLYPVGAATAPIAPGPTAVRGANSAAYKDTDAREAILLPRALLAAREFGRKNWEKANRIYQETIEEFTRGIYVPTLYSCGTFSELYELWGQSLNAVGRYEDTVRYLPAAREIEPAFASPALARAYVMTGDYSSAIAELEICLITNPDDITSRTDLGEVYLMIGELPKAQVELERAIEVNPEDARAHYILGLTWLRLEKTGEAREEFQEAADLDPDGNIGTLAREQLDKLPPE